MNFYTAMLLSCASLAVALGANESIAQAAQATAAVPARAASSQSTEEIGEIVVTAQRREQRLQDVPITINVVSGEQALAAGVTGTSSLQVAVPGLIINRQANNAAPYIRGIGTSNSNPSSENSVAIYLDGVYQPAPFGNFFEFNNIERVEVLKGPQGTLFGRNATGGVIQVITRDPTQEVEADLTAGIASYEKVSASAYVSGGISEKLAANVAIMFDRQYDGWGTDLTTGKDTFTSHDFGARGKLLFTPGDSTTIKLAVDYGDFRNCGICSQNLPGSVAAVALTGYPGRYNTRSEVDQFGGAQSTGVSLSVDQDFHVLKLRSISAYRTLRGHILFDTDGSAAPVANIEYTPQRAETYSQEFHLVSPEHSPLEWLAGVYLYSHEAAADPIIASGLAFSGFTNPHAGTITFAKTRTQSEAVFAQATYPIFAQTNLTLGARYTWDRVKYRGSRYLLVPLALIQPEGVLHTDAEKPTWRASLDHKFTPAVLGFVSYNRGFKTGNFSTTLGPVGNVPTQPEVLDAYETGLKTEWFERRLRLNGSVYYYDYTNIQLTRFSNGQSFPFNGGQAKLYGLDIESEARVTSNLSINGNLEYMHTRMGDFPNAPNTVRLPDGEVVRGPDTFNAKGNELPNAPKFSGNIGFTYTVPASIGEIAFTGNAYYSAKRYAEVDNRLRYGAYALVDASVGWKSPGGTYGVRVWGKNLTDSYHYAQIFSQAFTADIGGAAGPPRSYGVTAEMHFSGRPGAGR
ncbi:MAG TPA: TonB-dependent receptor [Steroidobacteraceae bacterium]|nr:TonB-dependent receptor [Steroidobacteraceae bacterium]